jgi:hypothetical protein
MPFPGLGLLIYIIKVEVAGWCDVKSYTVPKSRDKTNKDKKKERGSTPIILDRVLAHFKKTWIA